MSVLTGNPLYQNYSHTNYLDSYISDESSLRKALQDLIKINPEITRIIMLMREDKVRTHFEENCKLFAPHSYINFVTGFELTNKLFARFVQPKVLDVIRFETQVGSFHGGYSVLAELLQKEMQDRIHMLHTISIVHIMENYVKSVELVSDTERRSAKLCPKTGEGITKRILVNVKVDAINWMMSKMAVRKSIISNMFLVVSLSDEVDTLSSIHQRDLQCGSRPAVSQHYNNNRMVTAEKSIKTRSAQT